MLADIIKTISDTVDEGRLLRTVEEVARYHRIQASPGFRAAAEHCCEKLNRQGISAEVLSFPANEETVFDTYPSFLEWSCKEAWCELSNGRRIADFDREPISVIQKSIPCDYRNQPLPIFPMDKGSAPEAYEDTDLAGKLLFIREDFNKYFWAIQDRGAAGIITDFVLDVAGSRGRYDQLDTLRYTSFWWDKGMTKSFGFVLSPREGDRLAEELTAAAAKGETLTATCFIDAALYDGFIEDVTAVLPGVTDEEVLLTAHLCHPRASANDNASGTSAAMEALRVIKKLTETGALPPLKRSIRILLIPEFTGSYAYLDRIGDDRRRIVASMNLDMVGGKQDGGYGPLTITDLPKAVASNVCDLAEFILNEVKKDAPAMNGEMIPMFNSYVEGFSGGSDHIIFTDPQIGIPSLMLGQWPDKYYHTSSDTVDRIDTHLLARSCTLAAAYAYILANLETEDLSPILSASALRLSKDIEFYVQAHDTGKLTDTRFIRKVCRRLDYAKACAADSLRFFSGADTETAKSIICAAQDRFTDITAAFTGLDYEPLKLGFTPDASVINTDGTTGEITLSSVPHRIHTTLPQMSKSVYALSGAQREAHLLYQKELSSVLGHDGLSMLFYYIDGTRTIGEISALLDIDMDLQAPEIILRTCDILRTLGYLEFNPSI